MDRLLDRVADKPTPRITTLPDGSVDHRYAIVNPAGERLSREEVGRRITAGTKTFNADFVGSEPGGQAVNVAAQLHSFGAETKLIGHLDHEVLSDLPFETISIGRPADVAVYEFDEGAVMFATESEDMQALDVTEFERQIDDPLAALFERDGIVMCNWATVLSLTAILELVAERVTDPPPIVFDPGPVSIHTESKVEQLVDDLGTLDNDLRIILSPNGDEAAFMARAVGIDSEDIGSLAAALRDVTAVSAVVIHDLPSAAVATQNDPLTVPNHPAVNQTRHVGGGDRFTAGLGFGVSCGWSWRESLTFANTTSTYYLERGQNPTLEDIGEFLGTRFELE